MRYWEINGNLYSEQTGLQNIELFQNAIIKTMMKLVNSKSCQ